MFPGPHAGGGERSEPDRENQHQHQGQPERRHGLPTEPDAHGDPVPQTAALDCRHHAERHGQADREGDRHGGELKRIHQPWPNQLTHGDFVLNALAQVTLHRTADPTPVLDQHGLIEPVRLLESLALLWQRIWGQQGQVGTASQAGRKEHQHAHHPQGEQGLKHAREEVGPHRYTSQDYGGAARARQAQAAPSRTVSRPAPGARVASRQRCQGAPPRVHSATPAGWPSNPHTWRR